MKFEIKAVSIRSIVPQLIEDGGPSPSNKNVPPMVANAIDYLPFNIKDIFPIASTGERSDREVVVFGTTLENGQTVVIKVGKTYDPSLHGEAQERALLEQESSREFQATPLSPYVVPSLSLLAGTSDNIYDIRVQEKYVKGAQLIDLDLARLSSENIDTLISYHKALFSTIMTSGLYPETGIAILGQTKIKNLLTRFLRLIPLTSENVLFDNQTNSISVVDTGYPYNFSNNEKGVKQQIKKLFTASLIVGEIGLLYVLKVYK